MSALGRGSEDKIVVELVVEPTSGRILRGDEPGYVRARGTRQNFPPLRPPMITASGTGTIQAQSPPPDPSCESIREPARPPVLDPVAVLRSYPVSTLDRQDATAQPRQTLRAPSPGPHLDDKIRLAHLALDLYRELEAPAGHGAAHVCEDRRCHGRMHALRGALVEACLLVQRVAMMSPELTRHDEVVDRLRDLLAAIDA
jgi:hypothetical protein